MAEQTKIGNVPGDECLGATDDCLGLLGDLIAKLRKGSHTKYQLECFLKKQNPFTVPEVLIVNGGDPRWKSIKEGDYSFVHFDFRLDVKYFPIANTDIREVRYEIITFDHEPTTLEVINTIEKRGLRRPDRAEAEIYLDAVPDTKDELVKSPIVGLHGVIGEWRGEESVVGYVCAGNEFGRELSFRWIGGKWDQQCRFITVHK